MLSKGGLGYKAESCGREEDNDGQPDLHEGQIFTCCKDVLKDFPGIRQMLSKGV